MSVMSSRRACALLAGVVATGLLTVLPGQGAGAAVPGDSADCPAPYVGALTEGQPVRGLTVVRGTTPVEFTGTYYDRVPNGIARGLDMLVFRLEGPRITHPDGSVDAGIWAGMSGSPVYDDATGELIGAVSYGRQLANDVLAGVTPAAAMYDELLAPLPRSVRLGGRADGPASVRVGAGLSLRRLDAPKVVSGVPTALARVMLRKGGMTGHRIAASAAGSAPALGLADIPVVPGSNLAISQSYGDVAAFSVGTATAVCGEKVLGYGHPDVYEGVSTQLFHGARALTVNAEGGFGSFKDVAEFGRPLGGLDHDRIEGVSGRTGVVPNTVEVTSRTTRPGRAPITGHSVVSTLDALAAVVGMQVGSDTLTALNAFAAGGEAHLRWSIEYVRANGRVETLQRAQRYSTRFGLEFAVTGDVAADVAAIVENDFENVRIRRVHIEQALTTDYRAYRIGRVSVRGPKRWRAVQEGGTVRVPARARKLRLRVRLVAKDRHSTVAPIRRTVVHRLPQRLRRPAELQLAGNAMEFDEFGDFFDLSSLLGIEGLGEEEWDEDDWEGLFPPEPTSFDELIALIRKSPRQDQFVSTLTVGRKQRVRRATAPAVVWGDFSATVVKRRR